MKTKYLNGIFDEFAFIQGYYSNMYILIKDIKLFCVKSQQSLQRAIVETPSKLLVQLF